MAKYRSHPICRIKKFIELREAGMPVEEALAKADSDCITEGKIHGIVSLVERAERLGYKVKTKPKKTR